jgi:hypothetical protein
MCCCRLLAIIDFVLEKLNNKYRNAWCFTYTEM